ncbi:MAG: alpha/beta hydrolase [Gammaproteobacteria bacterium]|nr:alpha/beta hydrolase [Gammaproteobacteria bacterium]MBU1441653.1 alpha/beta hydrolase [Gammaproteobacteria bacterium]MBU2286841.1 alpha/beta hydrolase [Gammaproteobacteria bacterium]
MTHALPAALSGDRFEFASPAGRLSAYVAGKGEPLLLIHSINAAASAAEMRPLHEHYRATRTVFSIDLPGYGFSDRSDRNYTPRLMTDAIQAVTEQIHSRCGPAPIDALAVSLSCEYLARAAAESPARYRRVALVSPTGFRGMRPWRGEPGSTRGQRWLYRALRGPGSGWGGAVFRALTKPGVIRYFLRRTWGSNDIDETLWAYDVLTTKAPGAEHAPLHFLSANLFSADIHTVYERLQMPVWMSHGVRGDFTDYRGKVIVEARPNWQFSVFPTGALPYFELPDDFCNAFDRFLAGPPPGPAGRDNPH